MDVKDFWINGKSYNMTQVADLIALGDRDKAKFSFELMTGLSGEESGHYFQMIEGLSVNNVSDYKRYPINGYYYNVESVMEDLIKGDALKAYESLKSMGIDDEACRTTITRLTNSIEDYNAKKEQMVPEQEFQILKQRELDQTWYAPARCPSCSEVMGWAPQGSGKGGFSGGKAVAGAVLLGPIGLAAGALGKKQVMYQCSKCGFTQGYSKGSRNWSNMTKNFQ